MPHELCMPQIKTLEEGKELFWFLPSVPGRCPARKDTPVLVLQPPQRRYHKRLSVIVIE